MKVWNNKVKKKVPWWFIIKYIKKGRRRIALNKKRKDQIKNQR
jgi:hypothetical protein